ncbi:TM0106 family RecB-like putative nuclease [Nocardioides alcanivorans]|uniref:TM0106 family RecB-like putative nuclease n=1 Tax=Nocardioides alcanivorans TaxID=2897352 RepID=UPI001F1EF6F0|nr:bifunctional RecB family nuclease/DEAD/DEAH box helicase [Nocardioides alcanivorans]
MFLIDGTLRWSASDLSVAAQCEYALLRAMDYELRRAPRVIHEEDLLQRHIADLGNRHEARLLEEFRARGGLVELRQMASYEEGSLRDESQATLKVFEDEPTTIHQAAFYDGEFFGYADFVERTEAGWLVCDAKLARSAKPQALLQLGAYAAQIRSLGLPLAPTVALLLGNGERVEFPATDVLPVFEERRSRLRELLATHAASGRAAAWGDERYVACGRCDECTEAAAEVDDVLLVAGVRMDQRRKLREVGIATVADLASATVQPDGMVGATFAKLRAQADLQWRQMESRGADTGDMPVEYRLTATAADTLRRLPAPSPGDLFFDFEGDPMHEEGDPSRVGLEYLWGVLDADGHYTPTWAHSWAEERDAFVAFIDDVAARRLQHPDLHIHHYAPYEVAALKRLAMRYQTREKELDDLLRSEVFVDLYAIVRGSVQVGQPSYSIKKLEPLYMGEQLRESDVADGAASIVAYQEFREFLATDPLTARERQAALADYNEYDCLSTLRLRDWLLERATEAGVRDEIVARTKTEEGEELSENDPVFIALMAKAGGAVAARRTPEQQAHAMLATALDYDRREEKQYWWGHFERLGHRIEDWGRARDIFVVESAEVVQSWTPPEGRGTNHRRTLRLVGDWTPGSAPKESQVVYATPAPAKSFGPDGAPYAARRDGALEPDPVDPRVMLLTEGCPPDDVFDDLPVALVPAPPPPTTSIRTAIHEVASAAADAATLPERAVFDLMARRPPRLPRGGMPSTGSTVDDVVTALTAMANSYLAVQGPPGTGKTYTGSRVIKELVEEHGWRVGVVAQSHAVVENMLDAVVRAGLDPALVAKGAAKHATDPRWTTVSKLPAYLDDHVETGCVVGGTAWDFTNTNKIARESLDLLVVDEAGQFSLARTIAVSAAARRLLLLGDPQQLPQVSQGSHAEPVDDSALGWLMDGHDTLPPALGCFLGLSYRMHPALCAKVSTLSYDGRLTSAGPASERRLEGVKPGLQVITLSHQHNRVDSPEEAEEVVRQVRAHLGLSWLDPAAEMTPRPLGENDFRVVAPYNAQVTCIRDALTRAGLAGVPVGTVDKFQGQEAPVVIVSMTASSHGDVPRGMSFLLNRNRVNVAVSRAQWRAVLIRSEALTAFMPSTARGVLELGAFIGLCEDR